MHDASHMTDAPARRKWTADTLEHGQVIIDGPPRVRDGDDQMIILRERGDALALIMALMTCNGEMVRDLLIEAVATDGAHHKQWYLEELAATLGVALPAHEPGIAP